MFAKFATVFTLLVAAAQVAVASPPACLIAGVNTQPNPSDLSAVCNNATSIEQYLCKSCGGNANTALSAFSSFCGNAGVTVTISDNVCNANAASSGTSATGSTATGTSAHSTGTSTATTTGTNKSMTTSVTSSHTTATGSTHTTGTSTATTTSASGSSSSPTGNAAAPAARLGMDIVGMAALGAFGAMLAL